MTDIATPEHPHTNQGPMADDRLITETRTREIYDRLANRMTGGGYFQLNVQAWWRGSLRWARNRVSMAGDQRELRLIVARRNQYGEGTVLINQIDDASLTGAMQAAERIMNMRNGRFLMGSLYDAAPVPQNKRIADGLVPYPETAIWSDATYNVLPEQRATLVQTLMRDAQNHTPTLLSAGYIEMAVYERQNLGDRVFPHFDENWKSSGEPPKGSGANRMAREEAYVRYTTSQCSMTVRHPKGLGSGWAGLSSYDWSTIDSGVIAKRALDKCIQSLNPVAIEPGRYVVILEPQAVYEFAERLVRSMGRYDQENPDYPGVWSEDVDVTTRMRMTKLGQTVIDGRITISSDPMDPKLGTIPELGMEPVTWVKDGRLQNLVFHRKYALEKLRENKAALSAQFHMSGGTTSMEEMIASTKRGLIVTRFSTLNDVPGAGLSMLITGLTRDGLWMVENGKITKAVKNMRFTDSPLFVFNQVEQLGQSVPVFSPGINPPIVPPIKSRDFAFTATVDAI